eukprot:1984813-Prymnesium_polylepis.2
MPVPVLPKPYVLHTASAMLAASLRRDDVSDDISQDLIRRTRVCCTGNGTPVVGFKGYESDSPAPVRVPSAYVDENQGQIGQRHEPAILRSQDGPDCKVQRQEGDADQKSHNHTGLLKVLCDQEHPTCDVG